MKSISYICLFLIVSVTTLFAADEAPSEFANEQTPSAPIQKMVIVRHGESDHNVAGIYNSNPAHPNYTPSHLTEAGKAATKLTADKLLDAEINDAAITWVYVSPMPRTIETAVILEEKGLFTASKVIIDDRLTEVDAGDLEGYPLLENWEDSMSEKYHCEPIAQINARVENFYNHIRHMHPEGNILVVTHGIITQKLKAHLSASTEKTEPGEADIIDMPFMN